MNDARRQLLHETFKLVDLVIMMVAFVLAVWVALAREAPEVMTTGTDRDVLPARVAAAEKASPPLLAAEESADAPFDTSLGSVVPPDSAAADPGAGAPWVDPSNANPSPVEPSPAEPSPVEPSPADPPGPEPTSSEPEPADTEISELPPSTVLTPSSEGGSFLVDWWRGYREKHEARDAASARRQDRVEAVLRQITVQNVLFVMAMLIVWHAAFKARDLYSSRRLEGHLVEVLDVVRAGFLASLMVSAIAFPVLSQHLPIDQLRFSVTFFLIATGTTIIVRVLMRHILVLMRLRGRNLRAVLIVGTNHRALRFAKAIESRPELGYYVVGFVDEEWDGIAGFKKGGHKLVAGLKDLSSYVANHVVDEVVVALPVSSAYIYSSRVVSLCQEQGLTVRFVSQIFDSRLAKGKLDVFDEEPMLTLEGAPDESFAMLFKKIIDRSTAFFLLLLLSPLFLLVAMAIRLTSKGPVLFVQKRMGLNKRTVNVYKFRTMVEDAEERLKELEHLNEVSGPVFKLEKDPRITPIGDFLRRTSIDELPQLLNVLKGDMSLVGPRPLPERDYQGFDTDAHRRRLSVRPGITCIWQVSGRNSIPFEQWMKMDLEYIDNWSIWLDFKILLQTIPVVLGPLLFFKKGEFMKGKSETKNPETIPEQTP